MNASVRFLSVLAAVLALCAPAFASDKDDAVSLVKKAAASVQAAGKDATLAAINDPKGPFVKGTLYVFAFSMDGTTLAHSANPKLVGKNLSELKDSDGKLFIGEFIATAKSPSGHGWIDYNWTNPQTKKIEPKSSYIEKVGDMLFGCGIYR